MANVGSQAMTVEEFFEWQLGREDRYELAAGTPVKMMSGVSNFHDTITVNVISALGPQLRGTPCRVATADTSVRTNIRSTRRPDVIVTCDPPQLRSYEARSPQLVVEVLSPDNTGVRWQRKLEEFRRREGLSYILLIDSQQMGATLLTRAGSSWESTDYDDLAAVVDLPGIGCQLAMADAYEGLTFDSSVESGAQPR